MKKLFLFCAAVLASVSMWANLGTSGASSTFTCGTTSLGFDFGHTFDKNSTNSDTIVFSAALLYSSSVTYAYAVTGNSTPSTSNSDFAPLVYNLAAGTSLTSSKNGIYVNGSSNPKKTNMKSPACIYIKVTNCEGAIVSGKSSGASERIVLSVYNSDLSSRLDSVKTISNSDATEKISGLNPAQTYYIQLRHTSSSSNGTLYDIGLVYPAAPSCNPIGVASTGTAADVTYNSASLPFTMDKTTGVASLTINVYDNSDDSEPVATYSGITPATSGSQAATGLSETTTYYYTITTVSAGGDYCEGVTTAKSATFTTTAAPIANPTITGAVNEDGWGTVAPASITVTSGDVLSIDGATITCGDYSLTATPAAADAEYTYAFESWSGVSAGAVTTNLTATANFTRTPNTYDVNYSAATNGSYTIKVGEESAVSESTTAAYGSTVTLAATPASGYKLGSWKVYKTGEESTEITVTNNAFTMPAYDVTISATFVEATILYDYSVMAAAGNKSFTGEDVTADATGKSKTFGTSGNPQLVIEDAGWDSKENIINTFIKLFGNTTTDMSIVIPANKLATVTISYGSYDASGKYLLVDDVAQAKPIKKLDDNITTSNFDEYMRTVELTDQKGILVLNSNASKANIYIAYVDVAITGTITPTALDNTEVEVKAVKRIENGMLVIEKDGKIYNVMGQAIR